MDIQQLFNEFQTQVEQYIETEVARRMHEGTTVQKSDVVPTQSVAPINLDETLRELEALGRPPQSNVSNTSYLDEMLASVSVSPNSNTQPKIIETTAQSAGGAFGGIRSLLGRITERRSQSNTV
ncbi:MAG: hypothetical protein H6774_00010 [Pseudomonadales bacterium]|nr:hypothetical protein [Pseudomonadales bacterium]